MQNLLVLRFANTIFEPIWNRNYIDHVQITVAEEVDVGRRGGYYDTAACCATCSRITLLQLLMITAMEAPVRYEADAVRDEKVKVLQAIRADDADDVAAQHAARPIPRLHQGRRRARQTATPPRSPPSSCAIDNWRWQGVPFYLRSGKAMSCRTTQIVIQFREPPHMLFPDGPRSIQGGESAGHSSAAGRRHSTCTFKPKCPTPA